MPDSNHGPEMFEDQKQSPTATDDDRARMIRTDFSDAAVWDQVCQRVSEPQGPDGFVAFVRYISDPGYRDLSLPALLELLRSRSDYEFCFVVDSHCVEQSHHPILVIDLGDDGAAGTTTFRAVPSAIQSIENNLSIANMDFDEFAAAVDSDGVFRGFCGHDP